MTVPTPSSSRPRAAEKPRNWVWAFFACTFLNRHNWIREGVTGHEYCYDCGGLR